MSIWHDGWNGRKTVTTITIMKGDLTRIILNIVGSTSKEISDLVCVLMTTNLPTPREKDELPECREVKVREVATRDDSAKKRYYNLLYKLKRDGLIAERKQDERRMISITRKGISKLRAMSESSMMGQYEKQKSKTVIIVAFDVPERRRKERDWLRATLKNLEYRMIQKSVWAGTIKIPSALTAELRKRRLIENVEILSVQGGRLRNMLNDT